MNVFKNFYESVKRGYNQEPNLGPKESLIILIIICIVGVRKFKIEVQSVVRYRP